MAVSIAQARSAQRRLLDRLQGRPFINGIALRRKGGDGWELVVGVERDAGRDELPTRIGGVPVRAERVYGPALPHG